MQAETLEVGRDVQGLFFHYMTAGYGCPTSSLGEINYPEPMAVLQLLNQAGASTLQKRLALITCYDMADSSQFDRMQVLQQAGYGAWGLLLALRSKLHDLLLEDPTDLLHRICQILESSARDNERQVLWAITAQLATQAAYLEDEEVAARDQLLNTIADALGKITHPIAQTASIKVLDLIQDLADAAETEEPERLSAAI